MARPVFLLAWNKFREVQLPVAEVGLKIGGKVGQNIAAGIFENACPIRISYVLNMTGFLSRKALVGRPSAARMASSISSASRT